ncbi:MAG TPA: AMP-binding protein [Anaerolineae bacterium]|nr:AMP-binding protein [Anaerolineae bacterium]
MNVGRLVGRLGPQHLLTLARHVAGGSEFLITANERLTRRQLFARIDALAAGLQALGARKGDRIATLLPACPEAVYALFVPWVLGSVEVSLDPRLGEAALRRILADCAVKIVLTTRSWRSRAGRRRSRPGRGCAPTCPACVSSSPLAPAATSTAPPFRSKVL